MLSNLATPEEIERYSQGECHVFAVALHRMTGWPIHVVLDEAEPYWTDPSDSDNCIPAAVHVLCVDPLFRAWDIMGARQMDGLRQEMAARWRIGCYGSDDVRDEAGLSHYVGCWGEDGNGDEIDRPLTAYDEDAVAEASTVARRVLAGLGGFDPPTPVLSPSFDR